MTANLIRDVYAIDLGNGFAKRQFGSKVIVDPSVFSIPTNYFGTSNDRLVSLNDGRKLYIGSNAFESGYLVENATGEEDIKRYNSPEFRELLFGFMAKDLKADSTINLLVLGLPVKHFKQKREELQDMAKGKKMVSIGDKQIVLEIKNCIVVPQPLGTYMYLESKDFDTKGSKTLVIDGGSGTLDVTEMKGQEVISYDGANLGMNEPYAEIADFLETEYNGIDITVNHIPDILDNGLRYQGGNIKVSDMPRVVKIMDNHFQLVLKKIIGKYRSFNKFDNVVWTGGMALAHEKRINAIHLPSFIILIDGQIANVKGFYDFGKGLINNGKGAIQNK